MNDDKPDTLRISIKPGEAMPMVVERLARLQAELNALAVIVAAMAHVIDEHSFQDFYESKENPEQESVN